MAITWVESYTAQGHGATPARQPMPKGGLLHCIQKCNTFQPGYTARGHERAPARQPVPKVGLLHYIQLCNIFSQVIKHRGMKQHLQGSK
jgi:hypothetical protein